MQLSKGLSIRPTSSVCPRLHTAAPIKQLQLPLLPRNAQTRNAVNRDVQGGLAAVMTALVLTASPLSLAHTNSVLPDAPEIESPLEVLSSAEEQKRIRVLVNDSLADMLEAVDHLSRSTGSLLNLSTPEAKAGELLSTSQQVVDVALRMSEDAMLLAKEADELANLESVPEAERKLAYQIYEAAKLVSSIAHDLAMSERNSLAGMQDATQSS